MAVGLALCGALGAGCGPGPANRPGAANDANTPLHLLRPDYPVPYGIPVRDSVEAVMGRVLAYLEGSTYPELIDSSTGAAVSDWKTFNPHAVCKPGDFRLISYEWGVTYGAMLLAGEVTGNKRYTAYTMDRLGFIARAVGYFRPYQEAHPDVPTPVHSVLLPGALDDAGSMCAAMIKAVRAEPGLALRPEIDHYIDYILHRQYRLSDGTLARNRPLPNTLWLDDLFMSIPALAQMGKLTGDTAYYGEAVRQYLGFARRMFVADKGLFMHGWVESMPVHPAFFWARANGWALLANTELLDVLPESFRGRDTLLQLLGRQIAALCALQSGSGLWHQLLDREDTYLETSATAIYTYCIAHAIDQGWIDAKAYGPAAILGWNALTTRVNARGQVEGTCVGTGMGFDPAFYYYRPVNVYAAHGYGPVLMAGAEIIRLLEAHAYQINDSAVQEKG